MVEQCIVHSDGPAALTQLCGISVLERLLRTLERCEIKHATILSNTPDLIEKNLAGRSWARAALKIDIRKQSSESVNVSDIVDLWPKEADTTLILRADLILDPRVIYRLVREAGNVALVDSVVTTEMSSLVASAPNTSFGKSCGAALVKREWFSTRIGGLQEALFNGLANGTVAPLDLSKLPSYDSTLRRKLKPFWFVTPSRQTKKIAERLLLDSTQKGALDIPAWLHAPIEKFLISYLCRTPITPNQLTIFCNVIAWIATILFATGHLASGIVIALIVGVLDGLDGKQARLKVETTKRGKLEHWFDGIFEWSWWTALAYQFQVSGQLPGAFRYWLFLIAAEGVDAVAKGVVLFKTGRLIDELNNFERIVRLVGGRRNIYVWILAIGILSGAPAKAFVAMVWLELITAAIHLPHAAWTVYKRETNPRV